MKCEVSVPQEHVKGIQVVYSTTKFVTRDKNMLLSSVVQIWELYNPSFAFKSFRFRTSEVSELFSLQI